MMVGRKFAKVKVKRTKKIKLNSLQASRNDDDVIIIKNTSMNYLIRWGGGRREIDVRVFERFGRSFEKTVI